MEVTATRNTFVIIKDTIVVPPTPVPADGYDGNEFSEWWAFVTAFFVVILIAAVFCCLWRHAGRTHHEANTEVEMQARAPRGGANQMTPAEALQNQQLLLQRIARLFSFIYVEGSLSKEDALCSVCLDCFEGGCSLRMLPCLHRFHKECIDEWLQRKPFCPLCKANPFRMQQPPRRVMRALAALPEPQMAAARHVTPDVTPRPEGDTQPPGGDQEETGRASLNPVATLAAYLGGAEAEDAATATTSIHVQVLRGVRVRVWC